MDRSSFTQKSLLAFEAAGFWKLGMPIGYCYCWRVMANALLPLDLSLTMKSLDAFDPGFTWNALLPAERSLHWNISEPIVSATGGCWSSPNDIICGRCR